MTATTRRSLLAVTGAVAATLAAVTACVTASATPTAIERNPQPGPSGGSASNGPGGPQDASSSGGGGVTVFKVLCGSSHLLPDDPIVHPGMPGMSHLHQFFGNRTTNASSTLQSLRGQATTCSTRDDTAAYWVPMLYQGGVAVPAVSALIYYRGGSHRDSTKIRAFPPGLRVIAGSATATSPFPVDAVGWMCQGSTSPLPSPPSCGAGGTLVAQVRFPDCWDGVNLDVADHKSHMAYTIGGFCPSNYPVQVPLLEYNVRYKTSGGPGVTLSSGAQYTYHADFFNAWKQRALVNLIDSCLHTGKVCGIAT